MVEDRFKWLYFSRFRAGAESTIRNVWEKFRKNPEFVNPENLRSAPTCSELLKDACVFLNASEDDASRDELELFLAQAVIITALQRMKPRERLKLFQEQVDLSSLGSKAGLKGPDLAGPATTFAALGAAQVWGSVYTWLPARLLDLSLMP